MLVAARSPEFGASVPALPPLLAVRCGRPTGRRGHRRCDRGLPVSFAAVARPTAAPSLDLVLMDHDNVCGAGTLCMVLEPWWVHSIVHCLRTFSASERTPSIQSVTPVQKTGVCERALVRSMAACVEATVELFWSSAERLFAYLERRGTLPTLSYVFYVPLQTTLLI